MNNEPAHFRTFMNNGKAFPNLGGMQPISQCLEQLQLLSGHWQAKRYWISWDLQKLNLLENNLSNNKNNMKSQIKNKKTRKYKFAKLPIPTLNKILSNTYYLFYWKEQIMNNYHKIISLHVASPPPKLCEVSFLQKKLFMGNKRFWANLWGEGLF